MKGKESFSCKVGDYTTHSCAAHCNKRMEEDPNEVFGEIDLPEK